MKVVATMKGYLGSIREPGDVFEVPDGLTGSWFKPEPVEPKAPEKAKAPKKAAAADPGEDEAII